MIRVALYQPDIPQNLGAMMRLCGCLDTALEIIEPCGFPWDIKKIRQSGLDYTDRLEILRHPSWEDFLKNRTAAHRIILMTTKSAQPYTEFSFQSGDILLAGRESAGVPDYVHDQAQGRICIPMKAGFRSLNIVNATAMILGEALRQIHTSKKT